MLEKPRSGLAGASNPRCPAKKRIRDIETKIPKCAFEGSAIHAGYKPKESIGIDCGGH
jgi:hypothetical protein